MAEDPEANAVGEKCKKELRNWETSLKTWWGNLPQTKYVAVLVIGCSSYSSNGEQDIAGMIEATGTTIYIWTPQQFKII